MAERPPIVKVRAGSYRVGSLTIKKGEKWCVYHAEKTLPFYRSDTLQDAASWAQFNQPKESA